MLLIYRPRLLHIGQNYALCLEGLGPSGRRVTYICFKDEIFFEGAFLMTLTYTLSPVGGICFEILVT